MSLRSQGFIDGQDCSRLRYIITLVNDGNRALGPVFIRTSFPTGTSYLDSSIRPFELSSRYANWSISRLSIGESVNINLDLKVTTRRENYSSSSRAVTVYQMIRSFQVTDRDTGNVTVFQTSSDRRLSASNGSKFDADWSACGAEFVCCLDRHPQFQTAWNNYLSYDFGKPGPGEPQRKYYCDPAARHKLHQLDLPPGEYKRRYI